MDFGLTEEQVLLTDMVDRFLGTECPTTRVRTIMESETGHDPELWSGLMALGLGSILVPEEFGGLGGELLDLAVVAERMGYHATPGPLLGHSMAVAGIAGASGDGAALRGELLPAMAEGTLLGSVALGEAGERWDSEGLTTKVDSGKISGAKTMAPFAHCADVMVVSATDADGVGVWLVRTSDPGVEIKQLGGNDMTRRLCNVVFEDAPAVRLGGEDLFGRVRDAGLILLAADAYGGSQRCLTMARDYALEREQFGQIIGKFQAVKHQLANMAAELEPTLALLWYAAHSFDKIPEDTPLRAAQVKAYLTDVFDKIGRDSIELHGGIGFTWEFDLHLWFRRTTFDRGFLGDANLHRDRAAVLQGW